MTEIVAAATAWAKQQLTTRTFPAQIDLDALCDGPWPVRAVSSSLECGSAMLSQVRSTPDGDGLQVIVVIPLEYTDDLSTDVPVVDDLLEVNWDYGPGMTVPGFHILPETLLGEYEPTEEYRRHLEPAAASAGFSAYYRCWRTIEDAENGWEFARAVYFRSHTPGQE